MSLCVFQMCINKKMRERKESTKAYNCGALKIHNGKMLAIFTGEHSEPFNFYQDLMISKH